MYKNLQRLIWLSDVHLDFLGINIRRNFLENLNTIPGNNIIITGDIAESHTVVDILKEFSDVVNKDIYFVLGNHDYYKSSLDLVASSIRVLCESKHNLHWLRESAPVRITDEVCIIGTDGWYDGLYGESKNPRVMMNDWLSILDIKDSYKSGSKSLKKCLESIAFSESMVAKHQIQSAVENGYSHLYFATHVPPWRESSCNNWNISDDAWAPWFTSKIMGDTLETCAELYPDIRITVICGHSHGRSHIRVSHNLECFTAFAEYRSPGIEQIFQFRE